MPLVGDSGVKKTEAFGRGLLAYFNAREKTQERGEGIYTFFASYMVRVAWGREKTNALSTS